MREFHGVDAPWQIFEAAQHSKVFLLPAEAIDEDLAVVGARGHEVAVAHVGCGEEPRVAAVEALKAVDRLLLVHDPEVESVVRGASDVVLTVDHVQSVHSVKLARV